MDLGIGAMIASSFKSQADLAMLQGQLKMYEQSPQGQAQMEELKDRRLDRAVRHKAIIDSQRLVIADLQAKLVSNPAPSADTVKTINASIAIEQKYLDHLLALA